MEKQSVMNCIRRGVMVGSYRTSFVQREYENEWRLERDKTWIKINN